MPGPARGLVALLAAAVVAAAGCARPMARATPGPFGVVEVGIPELQTAMT